MPDEIKHLFAGLSEENFLLSRLEKALEQVKSREAFRRRNYGKFSVLLCGDHSGYPINLAYLTELKRKLRVDHGVNCFLGQDLIEKIRGSREQDIQHSYLFHADLIAFIDGKNPGTHNESAEILFNPAFRKKTLAFFQYGTYSELIHIPDRQNYVCEFKYPVPYREPEELEAKLIFGVKHAILYLLNKALEENAADEAETNKFRLE
ncbi:MAG: hypothetical protein HY917_02310 [Candidatus Diapherotrites archaeon]|nr:hypothetical protein [Candidatus Diapherotrites archaeon]